MANEIHWRHTNTNYLIYCTIRNTSHQYWNTLGTAFEALAVTDWSEYSIYLDETPASSYLYIGDFPATIPNGWYWVDIFEQEEVTGESPGTSDISDTLIGTIVGYWNGTSFQPWDSNIALINNNRTAAVQIALSAVQILSGTVDTTAFATTTTEFEANTFTAAADCFYNGRVIIFSTGTLAGQATIIEDYSLESGRGHFTVTGLTAAPSNADTFIIV